MVLRLLCLMLICIAAYSTEKDTLFIGCEKDYPPYSWIEDGEAKGIVVDLIRSMLTDMGRTEKVHILPWKRLYTLGLDKPGTLICTISRTEERESLFKWVGVSLSSPAVILSLKEKNYTITSYEELEQYRIGTHSGSYREKFLEKQGLKKGKHLQPVHSNLLNYEKLKLGRIDLWSCPLLVAKNIVSQKGDDFEKSVTISFEITDLPSDQYMAFHKETDDETVSAFSASLKRMVDNGTYEKILNSYLTTNPKDNDLPSDQSL